MWTYSELIYSVFVQLDGNITCELNNKSVCSLYDLHPWCTVSVENMPVRNFPTFMETDRLHRAYNRPLLEHIEGTFQNSSVYAKVSKFVFVEVSG